jgi:hypothetical protein
LAAIGGGRADAEGLACARESVTTRTTADGLGANDPRGVYARMPFVLRIR